MVAPNRATFVTGKEYALYLVPIAKVKATTTSEHNNAQFKTFWERPEIKKEKNFPDSVLRFFTLQNTDAIVMIRLELILAMYSNFKFLTIWTFDNHEIS